MRKQDFGFKVRIVRFVVNLLCGEFKRHANRGGLSRTVTSSAIKELLQDFPFFLQRILGVVV